MDENFNTTEQNTTQENDFEISDGKRKKGPGFGRGYAIGIAAGLLTVLVLAGGIAAGRYLALKKTAPQTLQSESQAEAAGSEESVQEGIFTQEFIDEVNTLYKQIDRYFLYDYDVEELQDGMLQGMVEALDDRYSVYYDESSLESYSAQTQGEYYGIGCVVSKNVNTGAVTVVMPYEGSPAYEAGLLPGDIIYAINDEPTTEMDLDLVVAMIKGAEGSTVKLTIVREGEEDYLYFDVERRQIVINTVSHEMLDGQIGYIAVSGFEGVTAGQFREAFEDLKAQGMKGLVIDMRNNGGGLLTTVEDMLDYLLPEGEIFYAMDKYGNKYLEYSSDAKSALDVPLAVLVNGNTASAAEVFSGNIQEFGVGTLVGTTTFGKGIMQNVYYTNTDKTCAVKLTVADYYIHSDRNIHKIGITPDVEIELDEEAAKQAVVEIAKDNQLAKALEIVREQIQ